MPESNTEQKSSYKLGKVVHAIHEDEAAYRLSEINLVRPPSYQWHRYQIILVNRDDEITEWWSDLGPSKNFKSPEIIIPALWLHTVAELRAIAEEKRLGDNHWQKFTAEKQAESTLVNDWVEQYEEKWKIINNQSLFGSRVSKQRNGFYKSHAVRRNK